MAVMEQNRLSEDEVQQVTAQLERILQSTFFHGSQRCCRFLQYSVQSVLSGCSHDDLKERIIGVEVFHREASYDTGQDSTVRVTANEVRKRLAQYYGKATADDLIIELTAGSYAATFLWKFTEKPQSELQAGTAEPAQNQHPLPALMAIEQQDLDAEPVSVLVAPRGRFRRRIYGILVISVGFLVAMATFSHMRQPKRSNTLQDVWAPLLNSRKPVTICIAQPLAYRPASGAEKLTGPGDHMVPLPNAFIGTGDAYALADITSFLASRGKPWALLPSTDTSFRDLTTGPIILIGAYSNAWTGKLADSLRFVFANAIPNRLVDRAHPKAGWTIQVSPEWTAIEDYAVISKFQSADTRGTIISLAGATNFGTEAAGKFLINPDMLASAFRDAPKNWRNMNFQIVLHVKVEGNTPEQPTVVAKYFW